MISARQHPPCPSHPALHVSTQHQATKAKQTPPRVQPVAFIRSLTLRNPSTKLSKISCRTEKTERLSVLLRHPWVPPLAASDTLGAVNCSLTGRQKTPPTRRRLLSRAGERSEEEECYRRFFRCQCSRFEDFLAFDRQEYVETAVDATSRQYQQPAAPEQIQILSSVHTDGNPYATDRRGRHSCLSSC